MQGFLPLVDTGQDNPQYLLARPSGSSVKYGCSEACASVLVFGGFVCALRMLFVTFLSAGRAKECYASETLIWSSDFDGVFCKRSKVLTAKYGKQYPTTGPKYWWQLGFQLGVGYDDRSFC